MLYAKSTGGFYTTEIHGSRKMIVIDPEWTRPTKTVVLQPGESYLNGDQLVINDGGIPLVLEHVPDMDAVPPVIEIDNPACKIPSDAVEISNEEHAALLAGQSSGKIISADADGNPVLIEPAKATAEQVWTAIKAERDQRTEQGGFKVGSKWFHSDQKSRGQQLGLVLLGANIPAGLQWKTMDGSFVAMTPALAQQILAAGAASDQATFAVAEAHNTAMKASADPSAYDFSSGWPKTFAEAVRS